MIVVFQITTLSPLSQKLGCSPEDVQEIKTGCSNPPPLKSPASSPEPLLFHVISVRAVGCQEEEAFSGSSGLIDMPFRQQQCQESNYCPQGVAAEAAKTFLTGRRVFPFPWFQILLLFSPVSAVAPAVNSREAQLPQQVWSR